MMTDPTAPEMLADWRRAGSLILHHQNRDMAGIDAILSEALAAGRAVELTLAICAIFATTIPVLHTETGQAALRQLIMEIAGLELTA